MNDTPQIHFLSPPALATAFAVASFVVFAIFVAPMQLSMGAMSGAHMAMGTAWGWMLLGGAVSAIVAGAVAGAVIALTYNGVVQVTSVRQSQPSK